MDQGLQLLTRGYVDVDAPELSAWGRVTEAVAIPPVPPAPAGGASFIQLGIYPPLDKALEAQDIALGEKIPVVMELRPQLLSAAERRLEQREELIRKSLADMEWKYQEFSMEMQHNQNLMKSELAEMAVKKMQIDQQCEVLKQQLAEIKTGKRELELMKKELAKQEAEIKTLQKKVGKAKGVKKVEVQRKLNAIGALYRRSIVGYARDQVLIAVKNSDLSRVAVFSAIPAPVLYRQYSKLLADEMKINITPHGLTVMPCSRCGRIHRTYDIEGDVHRGLCPRCVYITKKNRSDWSKLT